MPLCAVFEARLAPYLFPFALYLGFSSGVLAHYHNHRGVFRVSGLNRLYSVWLSSFYGVPLFSWVPTHNQNHRKFTNGPGDATRTSRCPRPDGLLTLLLYPSYSSRWQWPALVNYMRKSLGKPAKLRAVASQLLAIPVAHALVLFFAVERNGWLWGGQAYGLLMALPAIWASWSLMFINYV